MPRARHRHAPLRSLLAALLAATAGLTAALAPASTTPAGASSNPVVATLIVAPGDRTEPGVELTLTLSVTAFDGADPDAPVTEGLVSFLVDEIAIAHVPLDEDGTATATVTPAQGAHVIEGRFNGSQELARGSDSRPHSVLPETCADEAQPGAGAFVRHAYLVALRRCPDAAGYSYWVDRLETGAPAGPVASSLVRSAEAVDVVVDDAYRRILGRPADAAGGQIWAAKLRSGWATSQLWAALAASPEFASGTDGPGALVERAFARIVRRPADAAGAAYWQARLAGGSPWATWRALAVAAEVIDGVVADAHQTALGRAPSPSEAGAARATIRSLRGDWRLLMAEILGRPEATTNAQRYPDPEPGG